MSKADSIAGKSKWQLDFETRKEELKRLVPGLGEIKTSAGQEYTTKVISIINLKGGVAKTTTVVTLAEALAVFFRKKVLVIDLDPQGAATVMLCGVERVVRLVDIEKVTLFDLMKSRKADAAGRFVEKRVSDINLPVDGALDIIPSNPDLVIYNEGSFSSKGIPNLSMGDATLHHKLGTLLTNYDYVLIDCPPSVGHLTRFGLWFSDYYIVPTIPDFLSARMFYNTVRVVEDYKQHLDQQGAAPPGDCKFAGVIITKYQAQIETHNLKIQEIEATPAISDKPNYIIKPLIRQSVGFVRPFEEYSTKDDEILDKRLTYSADGKLVPLYNSCSSKYKSDLAGDLRTLAYSIMSLNVKLES